MSPLDERNSMLKRLELPQLDWKYEMRRNSQEVIRGIWVGPADAGRDIALLDSFNIRAIVVLRSPGEALFIKPRHPDRLAYLVLDCHERTEQNLIGLYPAFKQFVDAHHAAGAHVLVHDDGGLSRAPAMVAMWVVDKCTTSATETVSFEKALTVIQSRRYCMHVNPGFVRQLKEFQAMCLAQRQYQQHQKVHGASLPAGTAGLQKRGFSDDNEDSSFEQQQFQKRGRADDDDDEMQE